MAKFLISIESRLLVEADDKSEAIVKALTTLAVGISDADSDVDLQGSDIICATEEGK